MWKLREGQELISICRAVVATEIDTSIRHSRVLVHARSSTPQTRHRHRQTALLCFPFLMDGSRAPRQASQKATNEE